jgi:hypothetical protein
MNALSSRSIKVGSKLYLATVTLNNKKKVETTKSAMNHVFCCDISGSMYSSLPKMRTQLKNRISEIVAPEDTITIIVFSGRGECTTIKEMVKVNDPKALIELNSAIDRYMQCIGLTCFLDPVQYTNKLINENKGDFNWIFLSDGGNNDAPWSDVLKELEVLSSRICGSTIIEYGYYADTAKLNEMTEVLGGTKIVAEDFDSYVPVIEGALQGKAEERVQIDVSGLKPTMRYTQFVYLKGGRIYVVVANGITKISIPESVDTIYYLANKSVGESMDKIDDLAPAYAMAHTCASYLRYDVVEQILSFIGDKKFIEMYSSAYGKQKLFKFQNEILDAVFDESARGELTTGYKPNANRYSIIDLFNDLQQDETEVFVASPKFVYNRIGAKAVNKVVLTEEQKESLVNAKTAKDVNKVKSEVDKAQPKMEMINKGYPISNFVWNEDRANLSAQFLIDVNLEMPKNDYDIDCVDSFVFRNYTIIKDGILNVSSLPVRMTPETTAKIQKNCPGIMSERDNEGVVILDLTALPLVNKKQTQKVKVHEMTEKLLHLTTLKFKLKYLGYLKKKLQMTDDVTARPRNNYSKEVMEWLASYGITEKGYQPKTELDKTGDFYMALTFKTDFKSFSSIPKIEDVEKKLNAGKSLTPSELFLRNIMLSIDATYLDGVKGLAYQKAVRSAFNQLSAEKTKLQQEIGSIKFAMILSRKWFIDAPDMDTEDSIVNPFGDTMTIQYRFTETKQNL